MVQRESLAEAWKPLPVLPTLRIQAPNVQIRMKTQDHAFSLP